MRITPGIFSENRFVQNRVPPLKTVTNSTRCPSQQLRKVRVALLVQRRQARIRSTITISFNQHAARSKQNKFSYRTTQFLEYSSHVRPHLFSCNLTPSTSLHIHTITVIRASDTPAHKKRKQRDSELSKMPPDTSIMWPKMNKEELINYAKIHFASSFASLPDVSTMLFMGQKLDPRGGQSKLLIGSIVRDEKRVPLWAYITRPSWVAFSCRAGERLLMSALATDPSVMLDRPFKFIGTSRRTMGLEALVLYYHVAGNRWDKFETNPNTLINVRVLEQACRMVRNATTSQVGTANEDVPTPAAFVNTMESDVSSGSDSEDDGSLFVRTCKRCRRMDREDSRCRSEGHIKTYGVLY